jgi:beta-glucosidase
MDTSYIAEAVAVAKQADVVLLFLGEDNWLTGESNNRAYINLPGIQEELLK